MSASDFVKIPADYLRSIATEDIPEGSRQVEPLPCGLYYRGGALAREIFWLRLRFVHQHLERHARARGSCLDFGGGGGVMLPTLAGMFDRVVCVDLATREAELVTERYALGNVEVVSGDALDLELAGAPFDAVVAADVLEHFPDLERPVSRLRGWLRPGGLLATSLPSESGLYEALRRLFGREKPEDHYHTGAEVEAFLQRSGFSRLATRCVPLWIGVAPLYLVSVWRAAADLADPASHAG